MDNKKLFLGIFLVFIVLMGSSSVFAEDITENIDSQDTAIAISEITIL